MVPMGTPSLTRTPFIVLPAVSYRLQKVPLKNLEGLPGITVMCVPVLIEPRISG